MTLSWTLDKLGPMGRTAEDCALVLHEIAGNDPRGDADAVGGGFNYTPRFNREPDEITIGYSAVDFEEWPDAAARGAFQQALAVIRDQGFQTKEITLPDYPYGAILQTVMAGEAGSAFESVIQSGDVDGLADPEQIAGLKSYLELPASEYLKAQRIRSLVQDEIRTLLYDVQVLLSPTRFATAPLLSDGLSQPRSGPAPSAAGLRSLIPASNLCGLPAISVPCGFVDGLPVGLQVVGRPNYENQIVQIGKAYQDVTDFHQLRPPVDA